MKIFAAESSVRRVEKALAAHELILVDNKGAVRAGGKEIAAADAKPEIVWMTFDAIMGSQLDKFFEVALGGGVKWLHTQQTGLDSPRYREVVAKGVKLTNSHAQAPAIAEYTLANVLAETWPIAASRAAQAAGEWKRMPFRELAEQNWLIIGLGAIGREIAKRARGFGCKVTGINRNGRANQDADATATLADLPKLLPTADVVVLAAARTEETTDLVNDKFVAAMKPGSIIVNIARGELIVDDALLAGLDKGTPGLAILDVFRQEPLPKTHPYWKHPKVRVTGHTSSSGTGTLARADNFFLENLRRYQAGQPLLSPVGPGSF
ncbi:MAG TPA: NAD(P)-dependent oxidoreductase [Stellaceae bacterium]